MLGSDHLDERLDALIRQQWRSLGFHYDFDAGAGRWTLTGSQEGLGAFPRLLRDYVADARNAVPGEHEHYEPYFYLKVTTGTGPEITADAVVGSLADLARLADLVDAHLAAAQPGDSFAVQREYTPDAEAALVFSVREDGFDPAGLDPHAGRPS